VFALTPILTYLGSIPFIVCGILLFMGEDTLPIIGPSYLGHIESIISFYGLVIVSFMAGTHWGIHINDSSKISKILPITSNLVALISWISHLVVSFKVFIFVISVFFAMILFIDKLLRDEEIISNEYFKLRFSVTIIVLFSLALMVI